MFPVAKRPFDTGGARGHERCCCVRQRHVVGGLSNFSGSAVTPSGRGWYCSLGIGYVRTTRRGRRRRGRREIEGVGGCLTTITSKVLAFQNKTIY